MSDDFYRILRDTDLRIKTSARAHWNTTNILESYARVTTFLVITGGGLVSLVVAIPIAFEEVYAGYNLMINLSIFFLGGLTSIISTFQAIFRWTERAQSHRIAASHYTNARRRLEMMELNLPGSVEELTHILEELTRLSDITPSVPEPIWRKAFRSVHSET
ncbi:hypothetical protein ABAC402_05355 [Asticcacaulis sp. AC402]|nr:hypothetical protein ABAC402_05355 [Asticcacaulis sp. AC402]